MPVNFEEIRKREWPVLETMTFLDAACVSFAPQRSVHALKELADFSARQDEANSSAHHIAMDSKRHKAYQRRSRRDRAGRKYFSRSEHCGKRH